MNVFCCCCCALFTRVQGLRLVPAQRGKFVANMQNTVQHYARRLFRLGRFAEGSKAFEQLFDLAPSFHGQNLSKNRERLRERERERVCVCVWGGGNKPCVHFLFCYFGNNLL